METDFIFKKVKLKTKAFGNAASQFSVSFSNPILIESGSIGTVVDCTEDSDKKITFLTVRFPGGIFANLNPSTVDILA